MRILFALIFTGAACAQSLLGVAAAMPTTSTTSEHGVLEVTHDSGFDPRTDTPGFHNFESFFGRGGTCTGFSYLTRQMYLRVNWRRDLPRDPDVHGKLFQVLTGWLRGDAIQRNIEIGGWANAAEASRDEGVAFAMKEMMDLAHLRNYHPQGYQRMVETVSFKSELEKLEHFLDQGRPALLGFRMVGQGGHMVLAYKTEQYERATLIYVTDSNLGGDPDATVLVYDRATEKIDFSRRYKEAMNYQANAFYVLQNPDVELVKARVTRWLEEWFKKLPFAS